MYSLHPNPFSEKIRTKRDKKDSGLAWFDKTKKGIQNQYSKKCQWNRRRIPVILNEKEKDDIEEKVPGFFDENEVLQYSTNPLKEKLYFTCPRYWDLRTNLPIKPENVNKEDIIDNEAIKKKRVDLNKQHIIEFAENGIYKKMFPGFFDSFKNDNGFFIPCCFTKQGKQFKERIKDAEQQMKAIKEANLTDEEEIKLFLDERKKNKSQSNITEQYILYRFPLEPNRYGYLPKSLEDFFNISNLDCDKKSTPCLLRKGPESSHTKSFLGCLSILFLKSKPSIQKMIQHIKDKLTLDHILRFHGGNIPSIFYNESQLKEVDLEKYKDTKLYKKYTLSQERNERQLRIIVNGYENFLKYIEDKKEYVDYYYLWDMISCGMFNEYDPSSFVNLVIVKENVNKDITILCPSPGFSRHFYDTKQKTIMIYNKDNYFEPLLLQDKSDKKWKTRIKYHNVFDIHSAPFLKKLLTNVQNDILIQCSIQEHMNKDLNVFDILKNHKNLLKSKYKFIRQMIHVDSKVFGIELYSKLKKQKFILPCNPSGIYDELEYDFYDESIWIDYSSTKQQLQQLHQTLPQLKCEPIKRIINDNMIIGIMTSSNLFVKVIPTINIEDELIQEEGYDMFELNDDIFHNAFLRDKKRHNQIHELQLEKQFYNAFLNTIRFQLQKYENNEIRKKIKEIVKNEQHLDFETQQSQLYELLSNWTKSFFYFTTYDDGVLKHMREVSICNDDSADYCILKDGENRLMIPEKNLYTKEDNNTRYISLLVHDILSNIQVQQKLLKHSSGYFYDDYVYDMNKNEIILLEKTLLSYLDSLSVHNRSKYVLHDVYENINPSEIVQILNKEVQEDESKNEDSEEEEEEEEEINSNVQDKEEILDKISTYLKTLDPSQFKGLNIIPKITNQMLTDGIVDENIKDKYKLEIQNMITSEQKNIYKIKKTEKQNYDIMMQKVKDFMKSLQSTILKEENATEKIIDSLLVSKIITEEEKDKYQIEIQRQIENEIETKLLESVSYESSTEEDVNTQETLEDIDSLLNRRVETSKQRVGNNVEETQNQSPSPTYQEWREQQGYSPLKDLIIDEKDNNLSEPQSANVDEEHVKDEAEESPLAAAEESPLAAAEESPLAAAEESPLAAAEEPPLAAAAEEPPLAAEESEPQPLVIPTSKSLIPKLKKIFITKELQLLPPKIKNSTISKKIIRFNTQQLNQHLCTKNKSITKKWSQYFPPLTTEFSFVHDSVECNYLMMLLILKIHQAELFKDLDIFGLKTLLVQFYSEHLKDEFLKSKIMSKWNQQNKKKEVQSLKQKTTIEHIIHSETYRLSEIDVCLFAWHIKIPIVIYFHSKSSINCFRFGNQKEEKKHYFFIRINNGNVRGYKFNLNKIKFNPLIHLDTLRKSEETKIDMKEEIIKNTLEDFNEYLSLS